MSHVDGVFLSERCDLLSAESSVCEHTNLASGVAPVVLVSEGLQLGDESSSHFLHSLDSNG